MKKYYLTILLILPFFCYAQPGYLTRFAGNGIAGLSGDGALATSASINVPYGLALDNYENIYILDKDNNRIRKVTPWGTITTIAGGGSSTVDGVLATAAAINFGAVYGYIFIDNFNNIYFSESNRVRKIDISTGIVTTIAGSSLPSISGVGYSGDGGPATAAFFNGPKGIHVDPIGNIYIVDQHNNCIRKINTAGIITTIAGNGSPGFSGDGGPATAALFKTPVGLYGDGAGNLYVADMNNHRIRKIDAMGIVSTIAGTGIAGSSGDGGPATAALLGSPANLCMDSHHNLYVTGSDNRVRKITPTGIISTIAGGGSLPIGSENVPATNAVFGYPGRVAIDANDNIYIADAHSHKIFMLDNVGGSLAASTGNFSAYVKSSCGNTEFTIVPTSYSSALNVKTWFGDGHIQTDVFSYLNKAWFTHAYNMPATYSIKHVLYNGSTAIDSVAYSHNYQFCRTFQLKIFIDDNHNSVYDSGLDPLNLLPIVFVVDSSGITIDTITATSSLSYGIYAPVGTIYAFRPIILPAGLVTTFPTSGTVNYTVSPGIMPKGYLGVNCSAVTGRDLRLFTWFRANVILFRGTIIADNLYCAPLAATITMQLNPKYLDDIRLSPSPTSVSGTTATWNVVLSSVLANPFTINALMKKTPGVLLPFGDTVITSYSISPSTGDADPSNNLAIRIDTISAGYDPNDIAVTPPGCLTTETKLTYTIRFENTGNDTAHNIYVLDTLPAEVDVKSMRIVAASAVMNTYIKKTGTQNIVRFDFPDITLPDSSHHGQNSGMVIYSINRYPTLADGTHIRNRVGIYFDDNPPVLTNTAENTIGCPITSVNDVESATTAIYPNPVTKELFIETTGNIYKNYTITNSLGQTLLSNNITHNQIAIDTRQLPPGLYILTLRGSQTEVHKIIKQ